MKDVKDVIAGVPLAQYAAVAAALAEAFPLRAVLSIEGLTASQWAEADRGWTAALAQDPPLLARYEAALVTAGERLLAGEDAGGNDATRALRAGKARLVRSGAALPPSLSLSNAAAATSTSETAKAPVAMPTFMSAPPAVSPGPMALSPLITTSTAPEPPPLLAPPPPAAPRREDPVRRDTASFTRVGIALPNTILPFRQGPEEPSSAPPLVSSSARPPQHHDVEDEGTRVGFELPTNPLPFRPAEGPDATSLRALQRDEDWETEEDPCAQTTLTPALGSTPLFNGGLPFQTPAEPPLPPLEGSPHHEPTEPAAEAHEQVAWSVAASLEPEVYSASEWGSAPPPASRILPLEQHAALSLEIALDPANEADAIARFQTTETEKAASDEHYRARIAVDPELGTRWYQAYANHHAWLLSRSRS